MKIIQRKIFGGFRYVLEFGICKFYKIYLIIARKKSEMGVEVHFAFETICISLFQEDV